MNIFERRYCIVDYSGNYYTVNENDVLAVAKDSKNAQWFDILEANKRINNSGKANLLRLAEVNRRTVICSEDCSSQEEDGQFVMKDIDLVNLTKELVYIQNNIRRYMDELNKELSGVDEEICDIMHFVELYERDDEQNLELMDRLFDCRKRRRVIKDEHFRAEQLAKLFNAGGVTSVLKDINRQLDNMDKREYVPRRLPSLFVTGVKRQDEDEKVQCGDMNCREEETMAYEWHETIFDGTGTDWGALVSGQARMFEDLKQYIINLQIDLDDLDSDIEKLMNECENENCSASQGYRIFKQLKEKRLARRAKLEELDKVKTIANCFDCTSMADTYRYLEDIICGEEEEDIEGEDDIRKAM